MPVRGEPDADRAFRNPRSRKLSKVRTPEANGSGMHIPGDNDGIIANLSTPMSRISAPSPREGWDGLPPFDEIIEGISTLTTSFFQLGFIPKVLMFEQLRKDIKSVNSFLLFSILSISARFTPVLVKRYGSGARATQEFLGRASMLVQSQMFTPSYESVQGFFLMSISEWGNGDKNRSLVFMGIAVQLAGILRMHREETYRLPANATTEEIVYAEVARRTFWMLETFENLHYGSDSPVVFSYPDITVLLPCDEREFLFGIQPQTRAALDGTPPAVENPELIRLPMRPLFATLLQTHNLWGKVARLVSADAMHLTSGVVSHVSTDEYTGLARMLATFEHEVPSQHSWSAWNLRAFKIEGLDLSFFSVVMVLRLSNIILRRSYLSDMLHSASTSDSEGQAEKLRAWPYVAEELFDNMLLLHEQICAFFANRAPEQGYPALIVFCVYVCGSLANHLHQQPHICPRVAPNALDVLHKSVQGLADLQGAWPLVRRWYTALCRASESTLANNNLQGQQETSPISTSTGDDPAGARQQASNVVDVQFNDPFPSDFMFEAFESYLWSDVSTFNQDPLGDDPLTASAWAYS